MHEGKLFSQFFKWERQLPPLLTFVNVLIKEPNSAGMFLKCCLTEVHENDFKAQCTDGTSTFITRFEVDHTNETWKLTHVNGKPYTNGERVYTLFSW